MMTKAKISSGCQLLWGPAALTDESMIATVKPFGLLVEFTAFQPKALTEGEVLKLRRKYPCCPLYGCFDGAPEEQLLYYGDKHLIDGIICRNLSEKLRQRVRETTGIPLFVYRKALQEQELPLLNQAVDDGFFFPVKPMAELLLNLKKPSIFPTEEANTYILYCSERNNE